MTVIEFALAGSFVFSRRVGVSASCEYTRRRSNPDSVEALRPLLEESRELLLITDAEGLDWVEDVGKATVLRRFPYFIIARLTRGRHP